MRLRLSLLPHSQEKDTAIIVDILRMTTTSAVLMSRGLSELYVVADEEKARAVAKEKKALLFGERSGLPMKGFDGGNSPIEYLKQDLKGKRAVLCTSNGSVAVEAASEAKHVLLGSTVNASAVAHEALQRAEKSISISCAGLSIHKEVSLEDALGAAIIAREIQRLAHVEIIGDETYLMLHALRGLDAPLADQFRKAKHGRIVIDLGFEKDLTFAAERNTLQHVAVRTNGNPAFFVGVTPSSPISF
jgi:2-phosphosulfolactate phosphatase